MGMFFKKAFLIKKSLIMAAGFCALAALCLSAAAMGTDYWLVSTGCVQSDYVGGSCSSETSMNVNYGLFKGHKSINAGLGSTSYNIYVYCGSSGCIMSCGSDASSRKRDYDNIVLGTDKNECVTSTSYKFGAVKDARAGPSEKSFINNGSRLSTVVFLGLTLFLQLASLALCVFNVVRNPIEWWQGAWGIYGVNALAVLTNLITLAVWGSHFDQRLNSNIAIQETLLNKFSSDSSQLGYSFWLTFGALILNLVSCVAIRFRNALRGWADAETPAEDKPTTPGVIILY